MLVTGGTGFVGASLCRDLVEDGHDVVVLDDGSRGKDGRLAALGDRVRIVHGDVRRPEDVRAAAAGCEVLWHLAYINGTRFFYERPDDVLDVGIKGAFATLEAALATGVRRYVLASTSETYQEPTSVPTDESEPLKIPDVTNPRYSYGGGKIASELLTLHLGRRRGLEAVIFRPHNFYGPDMGGEHVVPEIVEKMVRLSEGLTQHRIELPIQGDGSETRSFCHVRDGSRGAVVAGLSGVDGGIYHVGTEREISIRELVLMIGAILDLEVDIRPGEARAGGTSRRCPDTTRLRELGFRPQVELEDGLAETVRWYAHQLTAAV